MFEILVEVRQITSRFPTGEVKTTKFLEYHWIPKGSECNETDKIYCTPSTNYSGPTIRKVK